jgi:hypothetical protein
VVAEVSPGQGLLSRFDDRLVLIVKAGQDLVQLPVARAKDLDGVVELEEALLHALQNQHFLA